MTLFIFFVFTLQVKLQGDKYSVKSLQLSIYQEGKKGKEKKQTTSILVNCWEFKLRELFTMTGSDYLRVPWLLLGPQPCLCSPGEAAAAQGKISREQRMRYVEIFISDESQTGAWWEEKSWSSEQQGRFKKQYLRGAGFFSPLLKNSWRFKWKTEFEATVN